MKYLMPIIALLFFTQIISSQKVEIISKSDNYRKLKVDQFIFLSDSADVTKSIFIAKVKSIGNLSNICALFHELQTKALELGSNSFKFDSFEKLSDGNGELVLSLYYSNDDFLRSNAVTVPKNKIYILGESNLYSQTKRRLKVGKKKYKIGAGTYVELERNPHDTRINIGGFIGQTLYIKPLDNSSSHFYSLKGFGIIPPRHYATKGGIGIGCYSGRIENVEPNLAFTLLKIYDRAI